VSRAPTRRCESVLLHHDNQHACTCVDRQRKNYALIPFASTSRALKSVRVVPQKKFATRAPKSPFPACKALCRARRVDIYDVSLTVADD
jgi:hypothetical protein